MQTFAKTFVIPSVDDIRAKGRRGSGSRKLEGRSKRQTYWLSPENIKMISALSKNAGIDKYEVVSAAERMLYNYFFDEGNRG